MGVCSVSDCESRSHLPIGKGKHLFRFPRENNKVRENWIKFVRKNNFSPKESSAICENHFTMDCFVTKKKGRLYLARDSVPTIYIRVLKNKKIEKIEIPYDKDTQEYLDESFFKNQQLDHSERENELLSERDLKVYETKNACRFCFEKESTVKCVAISKLEAYSIDPSDVLSTIFGFGEYTELLSDIVCENCFEKLVDFDSYKNRCKIMFNSFVQEIREIDEQLEDFRKDQNAWFQDEMINDISNEGVIDTEETEQHFDLIEEHLENEEDNYVPKYSEYQLDDIENDNIIDVIDEEYEEDHLASKRMKLESDDIFMNHKDIYDEEINKEMIITNPERNSYAYRIFQCFFCRLKFAGRNTYKSHNCQVKEVQCQVEGCKKMFTKQSGYSQHIVKVHGHLKLSKHFCPLCKEVIVVSDTQFKQHCKQCNKEFSKKQQNIECEICQKECKNLKSYTVHKMFHDSRNLVKNNDGSDSKSHILFSSSAKAPVICELCGRSFTNSQGLRAHKKNVHLIDSKGEVYQCDICSKMRPTKRSLFNHMRNVHRVQETPCTVCRKVFRTKALLQKHMIYHDETKRIHFCARCPERPGYFTAVALRRHQKSHHIGLKEHTCENCECTYTSSHMLKLHQRQSHGILC